MELRTTSFIESTGVVCSVSHNRVQVLSIHVLDHIWKEKRNHLPLWDKFEIIDRAEYWRIRRLKESAHMLGYNDLLSRPNIELNTIWGPIIKKAR